MIPTSNDHYISITPPVIIEIPNDNTAVYLSIGATLLGAIITGIISYQIFRRQLISQNKKEQKEEKDRDYVKVIGILLSLNEITNGLGNRLKYLRSGLIEANARGRLLASWWEKLLPLPDLGPDQSKLNVADFSVLIKIRKTDMISSIMELSARFNANEEAFHYANKENAFLRKKLFEVSTIDPKTNEITTKKPIDKKFQHIIIEIDSLFSQLNKTLPEDYAKAVELHIELTEAIRTHFDGFDEFKFEYVELDQL